MRFDADVGHSRPVPARPLPHVAEHPPVDSIGEVDGQQPVRAGHPPPPERPQRRRFDVRLFGQVEISACGDEGGDQPVDVLVGERGHSGRVAAWQSSCQGCSGSSHRRPVVISFAA